MSKVRIVVADDHKILRQGVLQVLRDAGTLETVGEAGTMQELEEVLTRTPCDVLILDLAFPGSVGIEGLRIVRSKFPKVKVLVMSMHAEDQYAVRCLKAGALGYLTKESASDFLIQAVNTVAEGKRFLTATVADLLANELLDESSLPVHQLLSDRELEVLLLIGEGLSPKLISERLGLNIKTVSTYRARVLEKTGLSTTADLVRLVIEKGMSRRS